MEASKSVVFVTAAQLASDGDAVFSNEASIRHELILPASALRSRGLRAEVLSLPLCTLDYARRAVSTADRVVFGKMFPDRSEVGNDRFRACAEAYKEFISSTHCESRTIFCLSDEHFEYSEFAEFYGGVAQQARAWIASSQPLRQSLEPRTSRPVLVYPAPAETGKGEARVQSKNNLYRLTALFAGKKWKAIGASRIRLLWFGHPTNVPSLLSCLEDLRRLSVRVPLFLECVTMQGTALDSLASEWGASAGRSLEMCVNPWSPIAVQKALEACDAVLLPQVIDNPRKRLKSNNRLIDAINAGRFAICQPLPSYLELGDYAWIGSNLADGVRWLLKNPKQALERIKMGQEHVDRCHSADALAEFWLRALEQ